MKKILFALAFLTIGLLMTVSLTSCGKKKNPKDTGIKCMDTLQVVEM